MGHEYVRDTKITVEVDTNKATYAETFESKEDFDEWWALNVEPIGDQ